MSYLADVNLWIALVAEQHVHHPAARRWFQNLGDDKLAFCRITQMGFLRLLTNKHVMQEEAVSPDKAWETYGALRSDWRIRYLAEPIELTELWHSFTLGRATSPNLWTDAYLCAFVHATGLTLVTFDSKIPKRSDVSCIVLAGSP